MDLRKRRREIIAALERNENVTLLYRGKKKEVILPHQETAGLRVEEHRFFGAGLGSEKTVEEVMDRLRRKRY